MVASEEWQIHKIMVKLTLLAHSASALAFLFMVVVQGVDFGLSVPSSSIFTTQMVCEHHV
jgi:hypothetical protein